MIRTGTKLTPAAQALLHFLERIERLEEERKSLADDIADIYKELTSAGYDKDAAKVVLKIRKTEDGLDKWTSKSGTVDTYLAALGMLPGKEPARARAHARVEKIEEFDAETGGLTDTQEQPETATQSVQPDEAVAYEYAGTSSDENPASISPSPAIAPSQQFHGGLQ